jgi:hypothetical protein
MKIFKILKQFSIKKKSSEKPFFGSKITKNELLHFRGYAVEEFFYFPHMKYGKSIGLIIGK